MATYISYLQFNFNTSYDIEPAYIPTTGIGTGFQWHKADLSSFGCIIGDFVLGKSNRLYQYDGIPAGKADMYLITEVMPLSNGNPIFANNPGFTEGDVNGTYQIRINRLQGDAGTPYIYEAKIDTPLGSTTVTKEYGGIPPYSDPGPTSIKFNMQKAYAPFVAEYLRYGAGGRPVATPFMYYEAETNQGFTCADTNCSPITIGWSNGLYETVDYLSAQYISEYAVKDGTGEEYTVPYTTYTSLYPNEFTGSKYDIYGIEAIWARYMNSLYDYVNPNSRVLIKELIEELGWVSGFECFDDFDPTNWYWSNSVTRVGNYSLYDFKTRAEMMADHDVEINKFLVNAEHIKSSPWVTIKDTSIGWFSIYNTARLFIRVAKRGDTVKMFVDRFGIPWVAWIDSEYKKIYVSRKDMREAYAFANLAIDSADYPYIDSFSSVDLHGDASRIYVVAKCSGSFTDGESEHVFEWESDSSVQGEWSEPRQVDIYYGSSEIM